MSDLKKLKEEFVLVAKRILKEQLSTNPVTLKEYERDIIKAHNNFVTYVSTFYGRLEKEEDKKFVKGELLYIRGKTKACFTNLNLIFEFPANLLEKIAIVSSDPEAHGSNSNPESNPLNTNSENSDSNPDPQNTNSGDSNSNSDTNPKPNSDPDHNNGDSDKDEDEEDRYKSFQENFEKKNKMSDPMTEREFLTLAAANIKCYAGDPLKLRSFINSVNVVKRVVGPHGALLVEFVKSKLEGRAEECVPDETDTIDEIFRALKNEIKPDNSRVIEGRMLALKIDKSNMQDYSKQAEELAEALERSLVVEGITQAKAKSMAIDRTVDMCRQSAKSDLVRSVLASATFNSPKEVVAKFVVESATETKEKQILAYRA